MTFLHIPIHGNYTIVPWSNWSPTKEGFPIGPADTIIFEFKIIFSKKICRVVTSSHQITEVKQRWAWLVLDEWPVLEPHCLICVEVSFHCPPSSDGYLVEGEASIVMTGYWYSKVHKCWVLPRGDEIVYEKFLIPGIWLCKLIYHGQVIQISDIFYPIIIKLNVLFGIPGM